MLSNLIKRGLVPLILAAIVSAQRTTVTPLATDCSGYPGKLGSRLTVKIAGTGRKELDNLIVGAYNSSVGYNPVVWIFGFNDTSHTFTNIPRISCDPLKKYLVHTDIAFPNQVFGPLQAVHSGKGAGTTGPPTLAPFGLGTGLDQPSINAGVEVVQPYSRSGVEGVFLGALNNITWAFTHATNNGVQNGWAAWLSPETADRVDHSMLKDSVSGYLQVVPYGS